MCASTPPAGRSLNSRRPPKRCKRGARQQQAYAEAVLLRRHDLEPDFVAHGRVEARAVIRDGELETRAARGRSSRRCVAAVRERRVRRVVEHVANRLLDRRLRDDRARAVGGISNATPSSISGCASAHCVSRSSRNARSSTWRAPALRSALTPPAMRFRRSLMTPISSSITRNCCFCAGSVAVSSSSLDENRERRERRVELVRRARRERAELDDLLIAQRTLAHRGELAVALRARATPCGRRTARSARRRSRSSPTCRRGADRTRCRSARDGGSGTLAPPEQRVAGAAQRDRRATRSRVGSDVAASEIGTRYSETNGFVEPPVKYSTAVSATMSTARCSATSRIVQRCAGSRARADSSAHSTARARRPRSRARAAATDRRARAAASAIAAHLRPDRDHAQPEQQPQRAAGSGGVDERESRRWVAHRARRGMSHERRCGRRGCKHAALRQFVAAPRRARLPRIAVVSSETAKRERMARQWHDGRELAIAVAAAVVAAVRGPSRGADGAAVATRRAASSAPSRSSAGGRRRCRRRSRRRSKASAARIRVRINATDAEDALKYFPSLLVRKRYIGDYDHAVLASRASGTDNSARSLVYADGILISNLLGNGATFTPRWGLVTPEEIERVDVLYGPFSAAYPGNSVGAVVDYVTRMPDGARARRARVELQRGLFDLPLARDVRWLAGERVGRQRSRPLVVVVELQPARQRRASRLATRTSSSVRVCRHGRNGRDRGAREPQSARAGVADPRLDDGDAHRCRITRSSKSRYDDLAALNCDLHARLVGQRRATFVRDVLARRGRQARVLRRLRSTSTAAAIR